MSEESKKDVIEAPKSTETKATEPKKKKTFWGWFMNFLMMGGFIVMLILAVALMIVISLVFK